MRKGLLGSRPFDVSHAASYSQRRRKWCCRLAFLLLLVGALRLGDIGLRILHELGLGCLAAEAISLAADLPIDGAVRFYLLARGEALLNGIAALVLLTSVAHLAPQVEDAKRVVDAMLVFGSGAAAALASTFCAYLRRTLRLQAPERVPLRISLWWLSVLAAVAGTACFLIGLNMAGRAVTPVLEQKAHEAKAPPKLERGPIGPSGVKGEKGEKGDPGE
jgi:hypothetical protein